MKLLTVRDIELLHMQIIDASGGSHGIRNLKGVEAAVATQTQTVFSADAYPSLFDKAAALLRGLAANHPFVDGNKRTAMLAALTLLNLNGQDTSGVDDQQLEDFAVRVVTDKLDIPTIAQWLKTTTL